jgi:uncharacterized Fe-S cluster protein YjdI
MAETAIDPRQPMRLLKKKNMGWLVPVAVDLERGREVIQHTPKGPALAGRPLR